MKQIIEPIDKELIKNELTRDTFLRFTRKGENEIYVIDNWNAPNVVLEIGRLREVTFRASGGGTGESLDLDEFDTNENCYKQLVLWSPIEEEIIGGYRFIKCPNSKDKYGKIHLSTMHYFDFSDRFVNEFLPVTIELGRSWIQPNYQPSINPRKGLFALDNIWDGLGALIKFNPEIKYFFGKVTMYPNYNTACRDFLLHFMRHYFPDRDQLMKPFYPLKQNYDKNYVEAQLKGLDFKDGFKVLNGHVRDKGEFIPPLVNIYMNLSPTMRTFGTAVEETGILVTIADIYPDKKNRHIDF